jgi:hypothetical protein
VNPPDDLEMLVLVAELVPDSHQQPLLLGIFVAGYHAAHARHIDGRGLRVFLWLRRRRSLSAATKSPSSM